MRVCNRYLVVTGADGKPVHGGDRNVDDVPGEWTERREAVICTSGWHVCTPEHLALWLYANRDEYLPIQVWECEVEDGTYPDDNGKVVGTRRKRTRCLGTLDAIDMRWLAADIACQTLKLVDDPRPGRCVLTIYEWCCGQADDDKLRSASHAAYEASSEQILWAASTASLAASQTASLAASQAALWEASHATSRESRAASLAASSRIILDYLEATA